MRLIKWFTGILNFTKKLIMQGELSHHEYSIKFDDCVMVTEMESLMEQMREDQSAPFPVEDIFHYSLRDSAKEAEALKHGINVTARDATGQLVGYMRVVSDRSYIHYLVDVMVAPAHQDERLGSAMVGFAVDELKKGGFVKILLTAIPGREAFYERMGFRPTLSPVLALRGEDYPSEG